MKRRRTITAIAVCNSNAFFFDGSINTIPTLVQIMACRLVGDGVDYRRKDASLGLNEFTHRGRVTPQYTMTQLVQVISCSVNTSSEPKLVNCYFDPKE